MKFAGDYALVGVNEETSDGTTTAPAALYIINVSDPSSPTFVARWIDGDSITTSTDGTATLELGGTVVLDVNVQESQTVVYLASSGQPYLYVLDATDPADLRHADRLEDEVDSSYLGAPADVFYHAAKSALFVSSSAGEDAVNIFDTTDPIAPSLEHTIHKSDGAFPLLDWPNGLSAEGDVLVVSAGNSDALTLVDISELDAPTLIAAYQHNDGSVSALDGPRGSAIYRGVAYTAARESNAVTAVDVQGVPAARSETSGVWTGDTLIVWGGQDQYENLGDGFALTLTDGETPSQWYRLPTDNAPSARHGHTAVWTGTEMIVWGGVADGQWLSDGASYNPSTLTWTALPAVPEDDAFILGEDEYGLVGRRDHVALWTGAEMIVFGGSTASGQTAAAFAYDPTLGTYRSLPGGGVIEARRNSAAVWTGEEILLFGGYSGTQRIGALRRLNPDPALHLFRKP